MMNATYSVEDNKLRLYASARLDAETYGRVKTAGFQWAPKQELFVAPSWSPAREDLLTELCGEIGDEDYSPEERAADRAERFGDYRDKRASEAGARADAFEDGPGAFGHQSRARAERQAARHDRHRTGAVSQWSKAEYWQARTRAVIGHALYKSSASVRRSRILRLEAEQRKHEKTREEYAARFAGWSAVAALEGSDKPGRYVSDATSCGFDPDSVTPALRAAYNLANYSGGYCGDYVHPRTGEKRSLYSHLTDVNDPITPAEAAALWLDGRAAPGTPGTTATRWSEHYANRLAYERAMLAEEGGTAGDADMVPGGWIRTSNRTGSVFTNVETGWKQIRGVNKSPATGRVVSVKVMGMVGVSNPRPGLVSVNVERLPEGAYRAPTAEESEAFKVATAEAKKAAKASKPAAPPLVNPTDADAERLQALWNAKAAERFAKWAKESYHRGEFTPTTVKRMTQAEYAAKSKGSYGTCETVEVREHGERKRGGYWDADPAPVAFKVRKTYGRTGWTGCADAVIVLTDKPQKALPLDWAAVEAGTVGTSSAEAKPEATEPAAV